MSTVQVGDEFEAKVFRLFSILLKEGSLFVPPNSNIFQKKKYYSDQRKDDIVFDIAIESYIPGSLEPSLIIFIECKHYKEKVPISDIEEFHSKVEQIAPNANKAILVTNSSFSEQGINFAKANHIALVRIFDDDNINWLLPREVTGSITYKEIESAEQEILYALCEDEYKIINNSILYFNGYPMYDSIGFIESIYNYGDYHSHNKNNIILEKLYQNDITLPEIDFLNDSTLISIANNFRQTLIDKYLINESNIETKVFIEYLKDYYDFSIDFVDELNLTQPIRYLAYVDYENKKIYILNEILKYENRLRFTLIHEISHLLLHEKLQQILLNNKTLILLPESKKARVEIQANKLTSFILLPPKELMTELNYLIQKYKLNSNRGYFIYLDSQPCNISQWNYISTHLSNKFGVSKDVIKRRLKEIGFLKIEEEQIKSFGNF
ncbi:restriction endonuclease [Treponema bryantii]|uniref:restriction endonuclease n=1 Tax=Treponema bryantii TaxID=163 RepID=UPI002B2F0777|nr:peptidase [Treponema bryantii]